MSLPGVIMMFGGKLSPASQLAGGGELPMKWGGGSPTQWGPGKPTWDTTVAALGGQEGEREERR